MKLNCARRQKYYSGFPSQIPVLKGHKSFLSFYLLFSDSFSKIAFMTNTHQVGVYDTFSELQGIELRISVDDPTLLEAVQTGSLGTVIGFGCFNVTEPRKRITRSAGTKFVPLFCTRGGATDHDPQHQRGRT